MGRVLVRSSIEEETNLDAAYKTRRLKTITYGHDSKQRLVLKDEVEKERDDNGDPSIFRHHIVTSYEQISPTQVRTVTRRIGSDGKKVLSSDYQDSPGQLQSSIHAQAPPDSKWQTNEDGTTPSGLKGEEFTDQYHGGADGGGSIPRVYRNENVCGDGICQSIANDLAAESGKWLYLVRLTWPRPFPYRKGQTVTLDNLPGNCPDLTGVITSLQTRFDEVEVEWVHEVEVESWRDA